MTHNERPRYVRGQAVRAEPDPDVGVAEGVRERIPLRRDRVVTRGQFAGVSASAPVMDVARFRADVDSAMDSGLQDPYEA